MEIAILITSILCLIALVVLIVLNLKRTKGSTDNNELKEVIDTLDTMQEAIQRDIYGMRTELKTSIETSSKTYNDAIVVMNNIGGEKHYTLSNWRGEQLELDGTMWFFDGIKAYNNEGSYYLLKDNEKGYAVIGRGFRRVGEWFDTEEEAHRAWRDYHPRP